MTDRPTRATVAGRAYLDLQNLARRTQRPTDELHQIYALEGFLARLVESAIFTLIKKSNLDIHPTTLRVRLTMRGNSAAQMSRVMTAPLAMASALDTPR